MRIPICLEQKASSICFKFCASSFGKSGQVTFEDGYEERANTRIFAKGDDNGKALKSGGGAY